MTADELLKPAIAYIRAIASESATENDTPNGLSLDSLDQVELIMEIELELAVNINDSWVDGLTGDETLREIADMLVEKINA